MLALQAEIGRLMEAEPERSDFSNKSRHQSERAAGKKSNKYIFSVYMSRVINMKLQPLCIAARTESLILTRSGFEPPPAAAVGCGVSPRHPAPRHPVTPLPVTPRPCHPARGCDPRAPGTHRRRCWCLWPGFKGSFDLDKQTVSPT